LREKGTALKSSSAEKKKGREKKREKGSLKAMNEGK